MPEATPSRFQLELRKWSSCLLVVFTLLLATYASAQLEVRPLRDNTTTKELAAQVPAVLEEINDQIGMTFDAEIGLLAFERRDEFNEFASRFGGSHQDVLGLYLSPRPNLNGLTLPRIALNVSLIKEVGGRVRSVLKHELCHAVLDVNIADSLRPLWFEEGVAQWISETPIEAALGAMGYASGKGTDPHSMSHLSRMIRQPTERGVAYAHALAALRDIEDEYGVEGVHGLLQDLKKATLESPRPGFAAVFTRHFESSYDAWAESFLEGRFRPWYMRVLQFFGRDVFSGMMIIGVILLIIGWYRKRRKEATILAEMKVQDEIYPSEGLWSLSPRPEQVVDVDAIIEEAQRKEAAKRERLERESEEGQLTHSASTFDDGDGYWTEEGWIQK